jgi:hypothetical protein
MTLPVFIGGARTETGVAKLIIARDAQVLQEVELSKERMTIGRHPDNDIVIAHRAVSGRHAAITNGAHGTFLEDLGSTNGTFVNGERVVRQQLVDRDRVIVAKFQIEFVAGPPRPQAALPAAAPLPIARIEVLSGANVGRTLALTKPLTTLGSPGVVVVVISRQSTGYFIAHIEGAAAPLLNGAAVGKDPQPLADGDAIVLADTAMGFSLPC